MWSLRRAKCTGPSFSLENNLPQAIGTNSSSCDIFESQLSISEAAIVGSYCSISYASPEPLRFADPFSFAPNRLPGASARQASASSSSSALAANEDL